MKIVVDFDKLKKFLSEYGDVVLEDRYLIKYFDDFEIDRIGFDIID